jgi:chorismate lyase/3-hydroxybenzoate synthase
MELSLSPAATGHIDAPAAAALPPLHVEYATDDANAALAADNALAVIRFGREGLAAACDPRHVQVALQPALAPAAIEIWRGRAEPAHGHDDVLRWSSDGDYAFVTLELDEADFGGIAAATRAAYAALSAWRSRSATPHVLRLWNYIDAINAGDGDAERYRQFCAGRAAGIDAATAANYPAASAIGVRDGRRVLQVCALTARRPGMPVENPRQMSAWCYPRQYGPVAPCFARALRAPTHSPQLHISGTAAVVGHASHHADDVAAQLEETLTNLNSLLTAAGSVATLGGARSVLKAYVRRAADAELVRAHVQARLGTNTPLLLLLGDICRAELLVEIDGLHSS